MTRNTFRASGGPICSESFSQTGACCTCTNNAALYTAFQTVSVPTDARATARYGEGHTGFSFFLFAYRDSEPSVSVAEAYLGAHRTVSEHARAVHVPVSDHEMPVRSGRTLAYQTRQKRGYAPSTPEQYCSSALHW
eukprot:1947518-Rhodomonas_salina.3